MKSRPGKTLDVLRKREEFLAIAKSGQKWVAPGLIVQAGKVRADQTPSAIRYGLTASGKTGNAIQRNRAKRRLRALAAEVLPLHATADRDYVLIARATTTQRSFVDLRQDLVTGLRKLGAWKDQ